MAPEIVGRVATRITYLQLTDPPTCRPGLAPLPGAFVVRACCPTAAFYRFLYESVGERWLWTNRRLLEDGELIAIIQDPAVELQVLWVDGTPAGFAELDRRREGVVDLAYFGLLPEFIGRGLGRWFLAKIIKLAFDAGPIRLTVNTCDLDHPRALATYRAAGFVPYGERDGEVRLIAGMSLPDHRRDATILAA